MFYLSKLLKVVKQIYSDIITDNLVHIDKNKVNIYGGTSGLVLFFELFFRYQDDESMKEDILKQMTETVSFSLNNLDKLQQKTALSGYAGVLWMLIILKKQKAYEELDECIEQLVNVVIRSIKNDLDNDNYDLLHGLMGKLLILGRVHEYVLNKEIKESIVDTINLGLNEILETAILLPETQEAYWQSERLHEDVVSVGLAHGQASYIWALSVICQEGQHYITSLMKEKVAQIIHKACNFLVKRIIPFKGATSLHLQNYFSVHQMIYPSQRHTLSWCNGALGVALALIKASQFLESQTIEQEALKILTSLSQIKKNDSNIWQEGNYIDYGLCHGTLGVFFIFYILHRKFGKTKLKEAYEYWLNYSISNIREDELFLGMKVCTVKYVNDDRIMSWNYMTGLLNGAAGYGIIFLSYYLLEQGICNESDLSWMTLFI